MTVPLLFLLNQKELELAVCEAKAVAYGWGWWRHHERPTGGVLLLPSERARKTRFRDAPPGLSHRAVNVIASCPRGNLRTTMTALPWRRILKNKTYLVRLTDDAKASPLSERECANIVIAAYPGHADLDAPNTIIDIVVVGDTAHIGIRLWEQSERFESRRAHLLPQMHPSMMHPAIARAIVNISCARKVHDPFCGAGGLLLEAGLAGRHASGADIEGSMLAKARQNCSKFGLRPTLRIADATMWLPRTQAIVTDMPYGKNTKPVALSVLFEAFLHRAAQSTRRVVVGLPTPLPIPPGWTLRAHMTSYVHKSMTKHFYVLERD